MQQFSQNRHKMPRIKPVQKEHGDWRVDLDKPQEAPHLYNPPLNVWRKLHLRVEYLQSADVGPLMHQAVQADWGDPHAGLELWQQDLDADRPRGWSRFWRILFSLVVLLPASLIGVAALMRLLYNSGVVTDADFWMSDPVWFSLMGVWAFICLIFIRVLTPLLIYIYVLGHEATHALAAILCLGKVNAFKFDFDGGYVETDKDNLFISLSPYFAPLWMLVWLSLFYVANLVYPIPHYEVWFYGGFGFWWTFHLFWTFWVIPREQPDMVDKGILFSALLIALANIGVLAVILRCFNVISFSQFWQEICYTTQRIGAEMQYFWQFIIGL